LNLQDSVTVLNAHVISRLTYASPVWSTNYMLMRLIVRDFQFKLNRSKMLKITEMKSLDSTFFRRVSVFIDKIIYLLELTTLAGRMIARSCTNERQPKRLVFFSLNASMFSSKSLLSKLRSFTDSWNFDWLGLTPLTVKKIPESSKPNLKRIQKM